MNTLDENVCQLQHIAEELGKKPFITIGVNKLLFIIYLSRHVTLTDSWYKHISDPSLLSLSGLVLFPCWWKDPEQWCHNLLIADWLVGWLGWTQTDEGKQAVIVACVWALSQKARGHNLGGFQRSEALETIGTWWRQAGVDYLYSV